MSDKTEISWTDATWNPVSGCSKVSPGCAHCYAEAITKRFQSGEGGWKFLPWTSEFASANVVLHPERLDAPLRWRKPRRVFVNSMSDLFHECVLVAFVAEVFAVMALSPQHTYQVLTKRPQRMLDMLASRDFLSCMKGATLHYEEALGKRMEKPGTPWALPLPNVWLGVSAENQHWADERIPLLLHTPAAVRFISAEPLLGPVDLLGAYDYLQNGEGCGPASTLDWVIVGGESGPKRRDMDLAWARSLRDQCLAAGTAFFFKQASASKPGQPSGDASLDAWKEFPK